MLNQFQINHYSKIKFLPKAFCSRVIPPTEGFAFIGADNVIDKEFNPADNPLESPPEGEVAALAPLIALNDTDLSAKEKLVRTSV